MNEDEFLVNLITLTCTNCRKIISNKGVTGEKLLEFSENYYSIKPIYINGYVLNNKTKIVNNDGNDYLCEGASCSSCDNKIGLYIKSACKNYLKYINSIIFDKSLIEMYYNIYFSKESKVKNNDEVKYDISQINKAESFYRCKDKETNYNFIFENVLKILILN